MADKPNSGARMRAKERPHAHAVPKDNDNDSVRMVNGRLVTKTLVDPDLKRAVSEASKTLFASKEDFVKEMTRRGVLTPTGKLTKGAGG